MDKPEAVDAPGVAGSAEAKEQQSTATNAHDSNVSSSEQVVQSNVESPAVETPTLPVHTEDGSKTNSVTARTATTVQPSCACEPVDLQSESHGSLNELPQSCESAIVINESEISTDDQKAQDGASSKDTVDKESANMYAEVASRLASKVIEINETIREPALDQQTTHKPSLKRKNDSLSLIMSYEDGSSTSSGEETEKEDEVDQFREHRYQTISVSSDSDDDEVEVVGAVQNGGKSSDDEETDHGSGNENQSDLEDEAGRVSDGVHSDSIEARGKPDKLKGRRDKTLTDPLMLDYLPPIEKLAISVQEEECVPVGKVYSIVDRLLVIESLPDTPPLMLDSVIFTKDGQPIGQIFDIFGHVKRPFYSIRFNNPEEIKSLDVSIGILVYCAPQTDHTKYVFTKDFVRDKGSDASWEHDAEPPPSALEYSDDEAERMAKQKTKVKKEKDIDSPARRRHLSFEKLMNRNNTLRNRAFKRDNQGEARGNWDVGWHNYKRAQTGQMPLAMSAGGISYDSPPPPPPPRAQQQILGPPPPCVFPAPNRPQMNATVNPMNLVIRPPCFTPVIDRPPPPPPFIGSPPPPMGAPAWARFEPPPTPPPRTFAAPSYVHSPPLGPGPFPPPTPPRMFAAFGRLSAAFPPLAMSTPPPSGASGVMPPFPTGYLPHSQHLQHHPHHPPGAGFHHGGPTAYHQHPQAPHHNPHHGPHHSPHQVPQYNPLQGPHHSPHQAPSSRFSRRPDHNPF